MWHWSIAPLIVVAALTQSVVAQSPAPVTEESKPIATRQTIFSIPFQIEKAQSPAQEPVEVRLYVSTDRAATWHPYAKVAPNQGHFLFRAIGDGEYWFLVRTLDRSGQVRPKAPNRPELRVLVDTTPPQLQLNAARGDAGQVIARWQVSEAALNTDSLKIHYRTAPGAAWQPVAVDWPKVKVEGSSRTGEVTWVPPAGVETLEVRAEATDMAGNPAVTHEPVRLAGDPQSTGQEGDPSGLVAAPAQKWRPARQRGDEDPQTTGQSMPIAQTAPAPTYPETDNLAAGPAAGPEANQDYVPVRRPYPPYGSQTATDETSPTTQRPAADGQRPQGQSPVDAAAGLPAAPRPRMVNSRVFELEYDVEAAGISGPARVELWGTRDNGASWSSFGADPDGRSPILVTVPEEGIYGFRVMVQRDPRAPSQSPAHGDSPDVWIGVDMTKPTARILSAQPGSGIDDGRLEITWEAFDPQIATAPVSLFYSDRAGGSWSTIATGLENTGAYRWTIDSRVPERIYLRLEVRDEAGNLAVFETPQTVEVRQTAAGARIRDVRPVGESARRVPKRYRFR